MQRKKRLGEIVRDGGLITETQLAAALQSQKTWGGKLGATLVRMGFVTEEDLLRVLSEQLHLPSVDPTATPVSVRTVRQVPVSVAERYTVMPLAVTEEGGKKRLVLAMSDPTNLDTINEIQFQTGMTVQPVVATESSIAEAIERHYLRERMRSRYGYEKNVGLAALSDSEEMVILTDGQEKTLAPAEGMDALRLVKLLIRVLERKGLISHEELDDAVKSGSWL